MLVLDRKVDTVVSLPQYDIEIVTTAVEYNLATFDVLLQGEKQFEFSIARNESFGLSLSDGNEVAIMLLGRPKKDCAKIGIEAPRDIEIARKELLNNAT